MLTVYWLLNDSYKVTGICKMTDKMAGIRNDYFRQQKIHRRWRRASDIRAELDFIGKSVSDIMPKDLQ